MKRGLPTAIGAITVLALAIPGAALAHDRGRHHNRGWAHAHHAKFRLLHVGAPPTPTTTPTPQTPENAGTVASYTGGVLTLTLKEGSVSGKVTDETRIMCIKETPTTPVSSPGSQGGPGEDDNGPGDDGDRGDMGGQGDHEWSNWQHGDDGQPDAGEPEPPCDSSALVNGATVRAAELRIGPRGTEFESVWLVR